jgi:hypothetical protein
MGYGRALLQRDVRQEEAALQKKAKKKSLWGSIGRTIGGLGVMALTGGTVNPVTLGLLTGGMSFLGGAAGAKLSKTGDLSKQGKFFKSDRESIQKELGAFGTQNLMSSLKSGLTAGMGQAAKLYKSGETAAKGLDFQDSFAGKTKLGKEIVSKQYFKDQGLSEFVDPNLQVGTESGKKIIAMDRRQHTIAGQEELMSKGKAPGLFRQTREGGAPILQDESLDAILQRQSASASSIEKAGIKSRYGGGGTGIDPSIQSTGNEFIDIQLGEYTEPDSASINLSRYPYLEKYNKSSWQKTLGLE